jgi:cell wall-associated NlpC family hydrolase
MKDGIIATGKVWMHEHRKTNGRPRVLGATMSQEKKKNLRPAFRTGALGAAAFSVVVVLSLTGWSAGSSIRLAGPLPGGGSEGTEASDSVGIQGRVGEGAEETGTRESSGRGEGESSGVLAASVVETALGAMGTPYQWGGNDANGFDCSGLIRFAYRQHGIELPRISRDQLREGVPVDPEVSVLRPGDVLGFSLEPGGEASHVGLYVGGGEFIHSSTSGVRVSTFENPYWPVRFVGATRILK